MQIDFASSGGVTNHELTYQVDTNTLPDQAAKGILRLIESSGVFEVHQIEIDPNSTVGRANVISYRPSLSDQDRQTTLWLNDMTAPASLRPLPERLRELALVERDRKGK